MSAAIATATGERAMRERAAILGRDLHAEDGVGRAVAAIDAVARSGVGGVSHTASNDLR